MANMIELSIPEFLATGNLGPIRLGASEHDVKAALGEPADTGGTSRKHRRPTIWLYGDNIQIIFGPDERAVVMILIDFWREQQPAARPPLRIVTGGIGAGLSREDFLELLASRRLSYEERQTESSSTSIIVENKVSAIFSTDGAAPGTYGLIKLIASR